MAAGEILAWASDRPAAIAAQRLPVSFAAMMFSFSPYYLISIAIQVGLIVHCIRTGRNGLWMLAIGLIPVAGSLAYILIEILPGLFANRGTRAAVRGVRRALDPGQNLRRFEAEMRMTGDVASRQRYADELLRQGRPTEAVAVYRQALSGLYEHDPNLLLGLAQAQFAAGQAAEARATLDTLTTHNPDFSSADGHLLYARALEGEGRLEEALQQYAEVARYYAGAEAKLRYALLLRRSGRNDEARGVLKELLDHARMAPRHYRRMQQEWLTQAERELATL